MPLPSITIVIPTRNRLQYLSEAVSSVLAQGDDLELIVVDDSSTDGTAAWLAEVGDSRVKSILLEQHSERSAARNTALDRALAEFVIFLDDDDRLAPGALRSLSETLSAHHQAVAAVGATLYFDERGQTRRLRHPASLMVTDMRTEVMLGYPAPPGSTLFRTEIVRGAGGWPTGLTQGEDQDLWLRVAEMGPVAIVPEVVLHYRKHPGQSRPPDTYEIERRIRERFIETLPVERQRKARSILEARLLRQEGIDAWRRNDAKVAYEKFKLATKVEPELLTSAFSGKRMRSLLTRTSIGRFVGPRIMATAQRLLWRIRTQLGKAPGGVEPLLPKAPDRKG